MAWPCLADLPPSVALGTVRSTTATGASCGVMRWSRVDSGIPRLMAGLCVPACPERAAADAGLQKTAEHAVVALYPHSSVQRSSAPSLGAAETSPRAPECRGEPGRNTGGGGAGLGLARLNDGNFGVLLVPLAIGPSSSNG